MGLVGKLMWHILVRFRTFVFFRLFLSYLQFSYDTMQTRSIRAGFCFLFMLSCSCFVGFMLLMPLSLRNMKYQMNSYDFLLCTFSFLAEMLSLFVAYLSFVRIDWLHLSLCI
ncbi:hypothetical protein BJ508DRAFT_45171 [Ascobolus immersus RN42]|uniref:Uncharacterized protein n=1 Tax=Ascobolus immersus RN42 TaxID=1160509 RepID=A0A3N4HVX6_ASCIM|nr:hypothetical protein BJ508DRAFT_45171 [Ascobolus immersus RN42]